jgi:putative ABC transport system permease protein
MWTRLRATVSRLSFAIANRRVDKDTRLEIDAHLDLLTERYRGQGMSSAEAYLSARRQFGNTTLLRQDIHEMNSIRFFEQTGQDLRYTMRQLRRSAGFASVVVATLGLGIGGATAVFSVVQAVLLAPLPYNEPKQLVRLYQQEPNKPESRGVLAGTHFTFLRDHATTFEDVAALAHYRETGLDLVAGGRAQRLRVLRVSSGYFDTLRARPTLGRGFDRSDEAGTQRVVLSDAVWRTHFAGDPSIVGTTVRLNAQPYEVTGIAPPGFEDPIAPDVEAWVPYSLAKDVDPENDSLTAIGRLRKGVTLEQSQAELATLTPSLRERWPSAAKSAIVATPLREELVARARGPLQVVFAAVALVLLVACVNVANLAMVRASGRVHEFAVRAALGSGRPRLARQLLVESFVLAGLGGLLGLALAHGGIRVLQALGREALPRLNQVGLNPDVLIFAFVATSLTAVTFGMAPILSLARTAPVEALRQQSRSSTGTRRLALFRGMLATTQLALALTLLAGAGVLLASFYRLTRVDLGIRVDRVLTFEVNLPSIRYGEARRASFHEELAARFETIPGVTAAGAISRLPATGNFHPWTIRIVTGPLAGSAIDRSRFVMQQRVVTGHVFDALGIRLLAGRGFDERDDAAAPGRMVVSGNFARTAFPGVPYESVLGQRLASGREFEIVGVVDDVALDSYGTPTMVVYRPHRQFANDRNWQLTQVVATERSTDHVLDAVRREVAGLDSELVVYRPATMAEVVGRGTSRERFALVLMSAFAMTALGLAALGLYGVLAYAVRQRTSEIGIRIALGATASQVRALVLRQAATVVGVGVAAGLAGALALGRWLEALTFGIAPSEPRILIASAVVLAVVAVIAAWLPAQRAAHVEPGLTMQEVH